MILSDLKKFSIRKQSRIHFKLRNGLECVVNEDGIAQLPGFRGIPDFNLEEELAAAGEFLVEPLSATPKNAPRPRTVKREELATLINAAPAAVAAADHDDD